VGIAVPPHDTVTVTLEILAESVKEETEAELI